MALITMFLLTLSSSQLPNQNVDQTAKSSSSAETPAPSPEWRRKFFKEYEPLKNTPRVTEIKRSDKEVLVSVVNQGKTPLEYYSAGKEHIQLFQEIEDGTGWKIGDWDWCGTGKGLYTIEPGEQAVLKVRFWKNDQRERMLGVFTEKDTKRVGLVVLAVEPESD